MAKKFIITEFRKLYPVADNSELALKYEVAESTIRVRASRYGLKKANCEWNKKDEVFILKHYGKGKLTAKEIGKEIGRTRFAVINKYRELTGKRAKTGKLTESRII